MKCPQHPDAALWLCKCQTCGWDMAEAIKRGER